MSVRLFLANTAAQYTPATIRGTWNDKTLTGASGLLRRKTGVGATALKAETNATNNYAVLLRRFVSEAVQNPATVAGAFTFMFGALESNASANMILRLHMFVTVGNTDVVRGILTPVNYSGGLEWPIVAFGTGACGVQVAGTVTPVAVQPGDRIVLEVGYQAANTVTTSYTGTINYGGTATDLVAGDRNVTTRPGWIEFADQSFSAAFAIPFRTGSTTTVTGPVSTVGPSGIKAQGTTTSTLGVGSQALQGYKVVKTTTGPVRPPGRPPGHPPDPELGSFTTGFRLQGAALTSPVNPLFKPNAVRIPTTTAESVTDRTTLKSIPYALLQGDHDVSPPDVDLLTAPPPPSPQAPLRFIAQDIRTHRFLSWELPLIDVSITWNLSGPTTLQASLHPESDTLSELGITAFATWIHVEQDGQLLASMILQPTRIDGEDYTVEAIGFSGYAQGIPYFSEDLFIRVDACDVMRRIWNHLQSYPDARLGVNINETMSGLLLGIPALQSVDADGFLEYEDGVEVTAPDPNSTVTQDTLVIISKVTDPETGVVTATYNDGAVYTFAPKLDDPKPYIISWYSDTDCGQEFDNLAKTAKVEYREMVSWAPPDSGDVGTIPVTRRQIELSYPRVGRKRFDLRCAQDENMLVAIPLEESTGAQGYASQVMTRGVGDGRDAIRGYYGASDPHRIRRVAIVTDQTIGTIAGANAYSQDELLRRLAAITVGQVVVSDWHPNAPLGSYMVGDEMLITGKVPWAGYIEFWHRIISYTWEPEKNIVTWSTRRSEQFAYGPPLLPPLPVAQIHSTTLLNDGVPGVGDPFPGPDDGWGLPDVGPIPEGDV